MIKRITDLEEMKRVVEVGDKIEIMDDWGLYKTPQIGVIVTYSDGYNVLFEDGEYGDDVTIDSLECLLESYCDTWDEVVLIQETARDSSYDYYKKIQDSIGSTFKIYIEPYGMDCYCGKVTLLNFNPNGQSVFLDKNNKLLIVRTNEIKYMKCIDK